MVNERGLCAKAECLKGVYIDDGSGDSEEGGVEAIEHAAVAGEDDARIFDTEFAFEQRLDEVSPSAEEDNHDG